MRARTMRNGWLPVTVERDEGAMAFKKIYILCVLYIPTARVYFFLVLLIYVNSPFTNIIRLS